MRCSALGAVCDCARGRTPYWRSLVLGAAALLSSGIAAAQAQISPVVVEFGPKQRVATVRIVLSEKARGPMRLQVQLLRWTQDLRGEAVTQPSEDLIVTPRIADLQPGQQQVLRLGLRAGLPAQSEMAYRLYLEDIAEPASVNTGTEGVGVSFRMAYDLPVMVAPKGAIVKSLRWHSCPAGAVLPRQSSRASSSNQPDAQACVRVFNSGNRRVKVQSLTVAGDGWQQTLSFKEGENILAGDQREWNVPLPVAPAMPAQSVQLRTVQGETLQAEAGAF